MSDRSASRSRPGGRGSDDCGDDRSDDRGDDTEDNRSDKPSDDGSDKRDSDHADWLVAHRGVPEAFPENSLAGVQAALEAGARLVEFDVQLSRDGEPVVIHDPTLERVGKPDRQINGDNAEDHETGSGPHEVGALSWDALSARTIGQAERFGSRFSAQRVPHLAEMLALVNQYPHATAFVELKRQSLERFGTAAVVEPVLAEIVNAGSSCVVISFDAAAVDMARARSGLPIGLGIKPWNAANRSVAERLAPDYLFIREDRIPAGERPFWRGDWQWVVYVVDDLATAMAWRERGADLIETDCLPAMLSAARHEDARGRR